MGSFGISQPAARPLTNDEKKKELVDVERQLGALRLHIEKAEEDKKKCVDLTADIEQLEADKTALEEKIAGIAAAGVQAENNTKELKQALDQTTMELGHLVEEYNTAEERLLSKRTELQEAADQLDATQKALKNAQNDLIAITERLGVYQDLSALKDATSEARTAKTTISDQIANLVLEVEDLETKLIDLRNSKEKGLTELKNVQDDIKKYSEALEQSKKNFTEQQERLTKITLEQSEVIAAAKAEAEKLLREATEEANKRTAAADAKEFTINQRIDWIQKKEIVLKQAKDELEVIRHKPINISFGEPLTP